MENRDCFFAALIAMTGDPFACSTQFEWLISSSCHCEPPFFGGEAIWFSIAAIIIFTLPSLR